MWLFLSFRNDVSSLKRGIEANKSILISFNTINNSSWARPKCTLGVCMGPWELIFLKTWIEIHVPTIKRLMKAIGCDTDRKEGFRRWFIHMERLGRPGLRGRHTVSWVRNWTNKKREIKSGFHGKEVSEQISKNWGQFKFCIHFDKGVNNMMRKTE